MRASLNKRVEPTALKFCGRVRVTERRGSRAGYAQLGENAVRPWKKRQRTLSGQAKYSCIPSGFNPRCLTCSS